MMLRCLLRLKKNGQTSTQSTSSLLEFLISQSGHISKSLLQDAGNQKQQEQILRRGLLAPRECAADLNLWGGCNRTRYWLRKWYLDQFRNTPSYHSAAAALYQINSQRQLPTRDTVLRVFNMYHWNVGASHGNPNADEHRRRAALEKILAAIPPTEEGADAKKNDCQKNCEKAAVGLVPAVDAEARVDSLSTLELLEAGGCALGGRSAFNAWCEANRIFEVVTLDYVKGLASYFCHRARGSLNGSRSNVWDVRGPAGGKRKAKKLLGSRQRRHESRQSQTGNPNDGRSDTKRDNSSVETGGLKDSWDEPWTVLELGAGNGKLSHFLKEELLRREGGEHGERVRVEATDSFGWGLKTGNAVTGGSFIDSSFAAVEDMDYKRALEKYAPTVVLVSWMPQGEDWTKDIRATASVKEYVLVGEADDGCCGDNWHTWGNHAFFSPTDGPKARIGGDTAEAAAPEVPPYVADGWTRHDLGDLSDLQLCRFDSEEFVGNSRTVVFRRA